MPEPDCKRHLRLALLILVAAAACIIGWLCARDPVPALTELLKDEDEDVRRAAQDALNRIQAPPPRPPGM